MGADQESEPVSSRNRWFDRSGPNSYIEKTKNAFVIWRKIEAGGPILTQLMEQAMDRASRLPEQNRMRWQRFCCERSSRNDAGMICSLAPRRSPCWRTWRTRHWSRPMPDAVHNSTWTNCEFLSDITVPDALPRLAGERCARHALPMPCSGRTRIIQACGFEGFIRHAPSSPPAWASTIEP